MSDYVIGDAIKRVADAIDKLATTAKIAADIYAKSEAGKPR